MNDVVDCIMISRPQIQARGLGKAMVWDKLPPFEEGTSNIDLSAMTVDPDVSGGYYCTVSVVNGTDENGRTLFAEFSVEMDEDSAGWSIEQGTKQPYPDFSGWTFEQFMAWYFSFEPYKIDGKSATLLLGSDVSGDCDIIASDGKTTLKKKVGALKNNVIAGCYYLGADGLYYLVNLGETDRVHLEIAGIGHIESFYPHLSPAGLSITPFAFYGEHSITLVGDYQTRYMYHREKISDTTDSNCRLASEEDPPVLVDPVYIGGTPYWFDWIFDRTYTESWSVTVIYTNDPLSPSVGTVTASGIRTVHEVKSSPIYFGDQTYWDEFSEDYDGDEYRREEIIEGCDLPLAPFEVPWEIGETFHTRVMKKPGEEIYFCVRSDSLTPDNKRTYWVVNSAGPYAYGDSSSLVVGGIQMLIDNVYSIH